MLRTTALLFVLVIAGIGCISMFKSDTFTAIFYQTGFAKAFRLNFNRPSYSRDLTHSLGQVRGGSVTSLTAATAIER